MNHTEDESLQTELNTLKALIRELADTEIADLACTGSMAPVEDILGRMFDAVKS